MTAGQVVDARDGRPLLGVGVSDGLDVTRTGAGGTFTLPDRDDAEFVFVTVPASHRALRPGWFVDVRNGRRDDLRFALAARDAPPSALCRFAQITDLHVSVDEGARIRPMLESGIVSPPGVRAMGEITSAQLRADIDTVIAQAHPEFIAATGDLADYGQRDELEAYRDAITGLAVPVASIPGNHDHLTSLSREAIDDFSAWWREEGEASGMTFGDAFQHKVFGGDWRRVGSGREPWIDIIGPPYFSFDWGPCHFVVYDGEGWRRYGDDYPQDRWLANDLATIDTETPVVVLTHFPETRDFYRERFAQVRLVASVSGHWHGNRVWHEGDVPHWTTSTLGFGGTDHTPRGYRVVEVDADGARSWWQPIDQSSATARVTGAGAMVDGRVIVAFEAPDATGSLAALDGWTHELGAAARSGVVVSDGLVFALGLTSEVVALDARTGEKRWSRRLGEDSVRWIMGLPAVNDGRVYAGSAMSVHAFDAADGTELWRHDLGPEDISPSWSGIAADADTVVLGASAHALHLVALDVPSGDVRWRHSGRDLAGVTVTPVIAGDLVVAAHGPGWLRAYAIADGETRWKAPLDEAWPVALAVGHDCAVVRSAKGTVSAHDLADGGASWTCELGPGPRSARPYSRIPGGMRAPLVIAGRAVWTSAFDEVVAIDLESGQVVQRTRADAEIGTIVPDGDKVVVVTVDGRAIATVLS